MRLEAHGARDVTVRRRTPPAPLTAAQREALADLGFFAPAPVPPEPAEPNDWGSDNRLRRAVLEQFPPRARRLAE